MEASTEVQLLEFLYACPVGLIECDAAGAIIMMNPHAMQYLLPLAGDRDATNLFVALEEVAPELRQITYSADKAIGRLCDGHRIRFDKVVTTDKNEPGVLACTILRLSPNRLVVTLSDISIEVARELRLAHSEAANLAKSQFLANMSHEIRTPLNGVLGMAQALALEPLSPSQHEKVQIIQDAGRSLLAVLNDILDLSKLEAGELELEIGQFDFEQMVASTSAMFIEAAKAKGLALSFNSKDGAKGLWEGDGNRCRQILSILLSNAIKFTAAGEVRVELELTDSGALRLCVSDTGLGIEAAEQPKLFDKFHQVDLGTTRRFGGSGLGLSICQELVQMMGGNVFVASALGKGSKFTVEIPLRFVGPNIKDPISADYPVLTLHGESHMLPSAIVQDDGTDLAETTQALRILAAEDNPTNQLILKALLRAFDVSVVLVENGQQAVEAWKDASFDLILMDIQMPQLDGVGAARCIRALEKELGRSRTPIVAVTANVMPHQIQEYYSAGMDGCVAKPIQLEDLSEAIDRALSESFRDECPDVREV